MKQDEQHTMASMKQSDNASMPAMNHDSMGSMPHMGNLKRKFFVCLIIAIPVLVLSPMMGVSLPFQVTFPGSSWIVLVLATFLFFYGGIPFFSGAYHELKAKRPAMMTLITLGIASAYLYSLYAFAANNLLGHHEHVMDFFWELATLIVIMLLGHWIEMKAMMGSDDALKKMAELLPAQAEVKQPDGNFASVPLSDVLQGQLVLVKAGEKVPADGTVAEGSTEVNESMVTGEARAVPKKTGDTVIGGSVNGSGSVLIEVTGAGESGYLAQVMKLVGSAQAEKSKAETMSDKVARWLFYAAVGVGAASFLVWLIITKDLAVAMTRMVTVLVIACPHALGLAVPLVAARSISLGASNGLLVRKRRALEVAPKVSMVMMDKTGTLTEGDFKVTAVESAGDALAAHEVLAYMAGLEQASSHPLATGILAEAKARSIKPRRFSDITTIAGVGLAGVVDGGEKASIVTAAYLDKQDTAYDKQRYSELASKGYAVSYLVVDGAVAGLVAQGDSIKPSAKAFIEYLMTKGIKPVMLTGDNAQAASKTAEILGLHDFRAGLLPDDKEKAVKAAQSAGEIVMMVGDGINDAPSLARADVGIAIGAGTDVAIDSADAVLVQSDPAAIRQFFALARNTTRKMTQNLWWGAGYNIVAIPLAAGILAPIGIVLSPAVGAVLMSVSTVVVALNALTLSLHE